MHLQVKNPVATFKVVKTDTPGNGKAVTDGSTIKYSITVSNLGTGKGSTTLNDVLPTNVTYLSTPTAVKCSQVATCTVAYTATTKAITGSVTLAGGATAVVTFSAKVGANNSADVTNTATLPATKCINAATCTSTVTNPVATFEVVKAVTPATGTTVTPGQVIKYSITVTNTSTTKGKTSLSDTLPHNLTYVTTPTAVKCSPSATCTNLKVTGHALSATVTLAGGATVVVTLYAKVTATDVATVVNTATITGPCTKATLCTSTVTNPVSGFKVVKTDTVGNGNAVTDGQTIKYSIAVTNHGTGSGSTKLADTLPANLTYVTTPAAIACSPSTTCTNLKVTGQNVSATVTLAGGATATITFYAKVSATDTTSVVNTATITGPCTTTKTCTSTVKNPVAAFKVVKAATPASGTTVTPGSTIKYSIAVSNTTTTPGTTKLTDTLPGNLTYTTTPTAVKCSPSATCTNLKVTGHNVSATVTLGAKATATITLYATVKATDVTTVVNTATITGPCTVKATCSSKVTEPGGHLQGGQDRHTGQRQGRHRRPDHQVLDHRVEPRHRQGLDHPQ